VRKVDGDYFTDAIDYTQVKVLEEYDSAEMNGVRALHGDVRVNTQVVGWKKVRFFTLENVGSGHLSLPEQEMHTTSFWLHFPAQFLSRFPDLTPTDRHAGLAGLGNALRAVASLLLMCDPRDLGVALTEDISQGLAAFEPNLYLYDNYSGGVGQSAPMFRLRQPLLENTAALIALCACGAGCPSCVGPAGEIGERGKEAAARFVAEIIRVATYASATADSCHRRRIIGADGRDRGVSGDYASLERGPAGEHRGLRPRDDSGALRPRRVRPGHQRLG
jgi:DEAD/DEAH box helicase domain-containing protein